MEHVHNKKNYIALFSAIFIWSSAILVTKIALDGLGPLTLTTVRMVISFMILLPFAWKQGFRFKLLLKKNSFIYGIFGYGGNLALLSFGMLTCSANISAIIHGLFPVFMILFGYFMLNETISRNKIIGIAFSVIGVIIASIGDLSNNSGTNLFGIFLVVLSVVTWSYFSVFSKKTSVGMNSFVLSEICFGASLICIFPFAIAEILLQGFVIPVISMIYTLLYLGIMSGALGILLWNYGLKKVDPGVAGIYFNLMPVIGLIIALFAGENITFLQILGCALVLAGVLFGTNTKKIINKVV